MTIQAPTRRRSRSATGAVLALTVVAGGLTPALGGTAAAQTAALATPVVVGPTDSGPVAKEVVLDWTGVAGATKYRVQVGTDDEWSDVPTWTTDTVASRTTLPAWLPHASYVWRVAAVGDSGQSRWGTGGTFTRGWLTKPTGLTTTVSGGLPSFSWDPIGTASEYQLQVSSSPYFDDRTPTTTQASPVTEACFTTRTAVTPFNSQAVARNAGVGDCFFNELGTGATQYWRVRGLDHVVDGAKEVDTTPVVDEGISHLPPTKTGDLDTTACTGDAASGGTCEPANTVEKGAWSAPSSFASTFATPVRDDTNRYASLPEVPTRPASDDPLCNDAAVCRDFPTVRWDQVAGADWYRVYVSLDAAYSNIQEIAETPGTSWTPTAQWRDSSAVRSYFYAVQPCTTTGNTPGCGPVTATPQSFRKSSPKLTTTATGSGAESLLSWQSHSDAMRAAGVPATSEAYAYHVQVTTAADPDFVGALVDDVEVDATHHLSSTKAYPQGSLLWRVQTVDASGHKLPWSAARSFVKDTVRPTVTMAPASTVAITGSVTLTFSEPVTGVDTASVTMRGRTVRVVPAADGRSAVVTPTVRLVPGASYPVTVSSRVTDRYGNTVVGKSFPLLADRLVDDRSAALTYTGAWSRLSSTNAVARTYTRSVPTPARPTSAKVVLFGRGAEVKGCVGPANGLVDVYADGVRVKRVDTYRSFSGCGVVLARFAFASGVKDHTVQVRGLGAKRTASKGTAVGLDAISALP